MPLNRLIGIGQRLLDEVMGPFTPPEDATPAEIRKNGLVCLAFGLLSLSMGAGLLLGTPDPDLLIAVFIFAGYALIGAGGYRVLTGRSAQPRHSGEMSPLRVLVAVVAVIIAFGVYFGLMRLAS